MLPLMPPPSSNYTNAAARDTICRHPLLFGIVTPIRVEAFQPLLRTHPNQPLVLSVCDGLQQGFWPWAGENSDRPISWDNSNAPPKVPAHAAFVREQRDEEIRTRRFSPVFGPDLLPGMTSIPIWVVPKPHSEKLCMVIDGSDGLYAPNALIPRDRVGVPLDNMYHLGASLIRARAAHGPNTRLVLFKSDVSTAYRLLPMSPLWQVYQIVTIEGGRHVDRCNNFGWRGAGGLWGAFFGLVMWIAINIEHILELFAYVDDAFGWDFEGNLLWYEPYSTSFPEKQTRLLRLWDRLGIPHSRAKQVYGAQLTIIGFEVDANAMTITMPADSRRDLITAIRRFSGVGQRRPLREFMRLAGSMNWALNTDPLLRPGLSAMYAKMAEKAHSQQPVWVSVTLSRELNWFADRLESSEGIHLLSAREWGPQDADITLYTDACPEGLAYWSPAQLRGFQHLVIWGDSGIFFLEALAVVSALHWALTTPDSPPSRVAIYTDNSNTVDMFNSLRADAVHNPLLTTVVDLLHTYCAELRVLHISGVENVVADRLSRFENAAASIAAPGLVIHQFIPPRLTLGARIL